MVLGDRLLALVNHQQKVLECIQIQKSIHIHNVINVVTHRHKQIKKPKELFISSALAFAFLRTLGSQFASTYIHLHLHGSAPLESFATSDNQGEEMSAKPRVRVRCVVIREASRS